MNLDRAYYGPACRELLDTSEPCPLGPGTPNASARPDLQKLKLEDVFAGHTIRDRALATCCLSGLWLLHGFLDESHSISQDIPTAEGSFWHGIMHRREPDYSNAKYWFRRVGSHPLFPALGASANEISAQHADAEVLRGDWDPYRFVDLCEQAAQRGGADEAYCRALTECEWRTLFDFCYRSAVAP